MYFNCVKTKLAERERKQVSSTGFNTQAELENLLHFVYSCNIVYFKAFNVFNFYAIVYISGGHWALIESEGIESHGKVGSA